MNAAALEHAGAGAIVKPEDLTAERLSALLSDTEMISAARRLAAEIASLPSPSELVPKLVAL